MAELRPVGQMLPWLLRVNEWYAIKVPTQTSDCAPHLSMDNAWSCAVQSRARKEPAKTRSGFWRKNKRI